MQNSILSDSNQGSQDIRPKIIVIGVGGAGGNAVNNMIDSNLEGVSFVVANTDAQALQQSFAPAEQRIQLGIKSTHGLGAGSKPEIGKIAAEESIQDILRFIEGANMVFITAGMGGGTGTGAAPVIARVAKDAGILTIGVVTKPFSFEGSNRAKTANAGIEELQQYVDTLLIIPNQNLFRLATENTTFADAFKMADNVLYSGVRGVTDLIIMPGLINLDFADIRAIMSEMGGKAMMGTGEADGERRALDASEAAISNPLLDDVSLNGASGILINITGGYDMTLYEVDEAANRIRDEVDPEANIIFGSTFDERLNGKIRVSVVATGIGYSAQDVLFKNRDFSGIIGADKNIFSSKINNLNKIITEEKFEEAQETTKLSAIQEIETDFNNVDNHPIQQKKRSGSFFDRFISKSKNNSNNYNSEYKVSVTPKKKSSQQEQDIEQKTEDLEIPACFRKKK